MKRLLVTLTLSAVVACPWLAGAAEPSPAAKTETKIAEKFAKGDQAPEFKVKDSSGKVIDLAELTAKGPVLVRLTCGCSGCDKELAYFQELHNAYAEKGLTSLAIFREPDTKVAKYVEEKKLNMLYAVDSKGESWSVFKTKTMPTNFLIDKGGKIISIASGCDPSGLLANRLSQEAASLVKSDKVDVKAKVTASQK